MSLLNPMRRRHVRNHRGDRAFACAHCGQSFIRREVWKRHEALHVNPQSNRPRIKPLRTSAPTSSPPSSAAILATPISQIREGIVDGESSSTANAPPPPPRPMNEAGPSSSSDAADHHPLFTQNSVPLQMSFSSTSVTTGQPVPPWPSNASAFSPIDMSSTGALFPDIGIESWLDQILTDQAALSVIAQQVSPQESSLQSVFWEQSAASPSSDDSAACVTLREWLSESGGRHVASLLDFDRFTRCMNAFWSNIDQLYPVIHRPTFSPAQSPPLLVLALVVSGATVTGLDEDFYWAEATFPIARGLSLARGSREPRDTLHNLQSIVFLSLAGHAMGQDAQEHAHALLSSALTLCRRANLYEDRSRSLTASARSGDLEEQWVQWILEESLRRVSWVILIRDIEYASFFQQLPTRASSPFRLSVELPCPESCWDAPTASAWSVAVVPGETLAAALKKTLLQSTGGSSVRAPAYTEFAQLVLTYGLCALVWDVNRRDLIAPEVSKSGPTSLNAFLLRTFTNWVLDPTYPVPRSRKQERLQGSMQDAAFLQAIDLHLSTQSLQVFVGVTEIGILRPVRPTDWIEASKTVRKWAASNDSGAAVSLASQYLSHVIKTEIVASLNRGWAVYIAFLICWSYFVISRTSPQSRSRSTIPTRDEALICCGILGEWARDGEEEPTGGQMRALSTHVVLLLSGRQESMVKAACMLVDRNAVP